MYKIMQKYLTQTSGPQKTQFGDLKNNPQFWLQARNTLLPSHHFENGNPQSGYFQNALGVQTKSMVHAHRPCTCTFIALQNMHPQNFTEHAPSELYRTCIFRTLQNMRLQNFIKRASSELYRTCTFRTLQHLQNFIEHASSELYRTCTLRTLQNMHLQNLQSIHL